MLRLITDRKIDVFYKTFEVPVSKATNFLTDKNARIYRNNAILVILEISFTKFFTIIRI